MLLILIVTKMCPFTSHCAEFVLCAYRSDQCIPNVRLLVLLHPQQQLHYLLCSLYSCCQSTWSPLPPQKYTCKETHTHTHIHRQCVTKPVVTATQAQSERFSFTCVLKALVSVAQEVMAVVPLVEVQSSRTQRPTSGTSYPYVDFTLGDMNTQRIIQLQLEQVSSKPHRNRHEHMIISVGKVGVSVSVLTLPTLCPQGLELCRVVAMHVENMMSVREKRLTLPPSEITML